jgi:hypothetical protein
MSRPKLDRSPSDNESMHRGIPIHMHIHEKLVLFRPMTNATAVCASMTQFVLSTTHLGTSVWLELR